MSMAAAKSEQILRVWKRVSASEIMQYLPAFIVPGLTAVAASSIFTRLFSPAQYGILALIGAVTGPVLIAVNQGLAAPVGRYYWEYHHLGQDDEFWQAIQGIMGQLTYMIGAAILVVFIAFALLGLPKGLTWGMLGGAAVSFWAASLVPVMMRQLQSGFHIRLYRRLHIAGALMTLIFPLSLVLLMGTSITWLIWGGALSSVVILLWASKITRTSLWFSPRLVLRQQSSLRVIRHRIIQFGVPLVPWFLLISFLRTSDRYVLALYRGAGDVGIYNTTYLLIAESIGMMMRLVMAAVWPRMAASWAEGSKARVSNDIRRVTSVFIVLGLAVLGMEGSFGDLAFHWLLGRRYMMGQTVIVPILGAMIIWGICDVGQKIFELANKPSRMIYPAMGALALNLTLNFIFAPKWGLEAVAWDTLIAFGAYGLGLWCLTLWILPWTVEWVPLGVYAAMAFGAWAVSYRLIFNPSATLWLALLQAAIFSALYFPGVWGGWIWFRRRELLRNALNIRISK